MSLLNEQGSLFKTNLKGTGSSKFCKVVTGEGVTKFLMKLIRAAVKGKSRKKASCGWNNLDGPKIYDLRNMFYVEHALFCVFKATPTIQIVHCILLFVQEIICKIHSYLFAVLMSNNDDFAHQNARI